MNELLGIKIRNIRLDRKETLEKFGERLNATKSNVSKWENGRNKPNHSRIRAIAELGNTTVDDLLGVDCKMCTGNESIGLFEVVIHYCPNCGRRLPK